MSVSTSHLTTDSYDWVWDSLNSPILLNNAGYQVSLMSMIFDEADRRKKSYLQVVENLLRVFILSLAQEKSNLEEYVSLVSESHLRAMKVKQYIKDNISQHLDENKLGSHLHISARQLNRCLISETGMTVKELIDQIRYERACELLQTDVCQRDISAILGFSDISSFCRFFKRLSNGITPGQWLLLNER